MPSNAAARELYLHPNANVTVVVHGIERRTLSDIPGIATVAEQVTVLINEGAIDRRPGSINPLTGTPCVRFLESLKNIT